MGLDQYAFAVDNDNQVKIASWRKHNRLQGWMTTLAETKGVIQKGDEFNCIDLEIDKEDLNKLEESITSFKLPKTGGFFFGLDSYSDSINYSHHNDDMAFVAKARKALGNGFRVVYSCWY